MRQFMKPERIRIIAVLAIFNYIFLGSEYLFDNMIRYATDSAGVVRAQNYVLGISVIGFLLFPCINRYFNQKMREIGLYLLPIAGIICIFVIQEHLSYRSMLLSGFLLYILYGMIGSAVHYYAVVSLSTEKGLAQTVGFGYAFGLLLQFISNNLIHNSTVESVALSVFLAAMVLLVRRLSLECSRGVVGAEDSGSDSDTDIRKNNRRSLRHPMLAALLLISIVVLMTCIFSSLDNAVTLVHAGGSVDIGQWPRLLLAVEELDLHLVMVGHSERRHVFGESNIEENKKMLAAMKHGFTGLLCIGETKEEKGYGIADEVLRTQIKVGLHGIAAEDLDKVWIAYEPVWAIGVNGIPAPVEYAQEKHHVIRETLRELYGEAADVVPALYGGSVNLENATRLFVQPDIDGLYVGRVAWDAKRFAGLIADCLATGEK